MRNSSELGPALDAESRRCLLCVRVPFEMLVSASEKMTNDLGAAYSEAENAARLIKEVYLRKPYLLCGRAPKSLAAAALYLVRSDPRLTQGALSKSLNITEPTIRAVARLFPEDIARRYEFVSSLNPYKGKHRCSHCGKAYSHEPIRGRARLPSWQGGGWTTAGCCSKECADAWEKEVGG